MIPAVEKADRFGEVHENEGLGEGKKKANHDG
jgi:hypothetical protein